MFAIISDVHANREALETVLAELDGLKPERIVCLGDLVGYGPDPAWCVDTIRERCQIVIGGNHDLALVYGARDFTESAGATVRYHRQILMPRMDDSPQDEQRVQRWNFLKALPHRHEEDGRLFVHGSPRNPVSEYLRERDCKLGMMDKLSENFALIPWVCFVGHTHQPGVITGDLDFIRPEAAYRVEEGKKVIINVGSVGQPRDKDPRASFVTVNWPEIQFLRVEYDLETTVRKLESTGGPDPNFPARLRAGV